MDFLAAMATGDPILGIDLGTTNSLVGCVDSGFPLLYADGDGERLTPSAVFYPPEEEGAPVVGRPALRRRTTHPSRTAVSAKRSIGSGRTLPIEGREVTAVDVSAEILRHLKGIAESAMEEPCGKAVITVPAYFNDAQRNATIRAGEMAGLEVVRIVNEPTAAALAYGLDKLDSNSKVAVYDFGGGTFDISILELSEGVFEVRSTCGDTQLGGDDIDRALADIFLAEAAAAAGVKAADAANSHEVDALFLTEARRVKESLSTNESVAARFPFWNGQDSFEREFSRGEFEGIARSIVERTIPLCRRALQDAAFEPGALDSVILVGGSTRIPLVRSMVEDLFKKDPDTSQNPDEAVAQGAVIQAGILSGALRQVLLLDITPLSLGIETFGGLMNVIIPRNTTIPVKRGEMFTNAVANQQSMAIRILQGERELARDNWQLGEIEVPFPPGAKGSARVGVQFELDANGVLTVLCRDTATSEDTILEIQSAAVDVEDEEVEKMISESVDHAFEDMNARRWTEAALKAEELLGAVSQALPLAENAIDPSERAAIEAAAEEVREALASSNLSRLIESNGNLDGATEHLAAILVEQALG